MPSITCVEDKIAKLTFFNKFPPIKKDNYI